MEKHNCKVCVTGGASYIGSSLVKKLLDSGYTVHATLRNLNDESKVGLLKSFANAKTRIELFEADIHEPESFEKAIQGCQFVFHVAHPMYYSEGHKKNGVEATIDAAKSIALACIRSGTVKRLIYTASVTAASPFKDDGDGYKDSMDETCWTPLQLSIAYSNVFLKEYTDAKTLAEKELLNICNNNNDGKLELVTLACGLVGGETYLSYTPTSVAVFLSPLTNNEVLYNSFKFLEELIGKVPSAHIEDVIEAHVFCMEKNSINGRFLCASSYVSTSEIADYYQQNYPEFNLHKEYLNGPRREIQWGSTKLIDEGFKYKYDMKMILDDCISCARKRGDLKL